MAKQLLHTDPTVVCWFIDHSTIIERVKHESDNISALHIHQSKTVIISLKNDWHDIVFI